MTPGVRSRSLLVLLALLGWAGCVRVIAEPALPMPDRPSITFYRTPLGICIIEPEANQLVKWLQKLNEFEAARERLLKD